MVTLKVKVVEKIEIQAENTTKINFTFDLIEGENVLETRSLNFPLDMPKADIKAELQKFLDTYNQDRDMAAKNEAADAANANADAVIEEFKGIELSSGEVVDEAPAVEGETVVETPTEPEQPSQPESPVQDTPPQDTPSEPASPTE